MMAALLMMTSMWAIESSDRMADAAARTLDMRERSTGTNLTAVEGEMALTASMVG